MDAKGCAKEDRLQRPSENALPQHGEGSIAGMLRRALILQAGLGPLLSMTGVEGYRRKGQRLEGGPAESGSSQEWNGV